MAASSQSDTPWVIHGRFMIEAVNEDQANRALGAMERAAGRASASVTIHVHASEANDGEF
jgi:hypothetical protein